MNILKILCIGNTERIHSILQLMILKKGLLEGQRVSIFLKNSEESIKNSGPWTHIILKNDEFLKFINIDNTKLLFYDYIEYTKYPNAIMCPVDRVWKLMISELVFIKKDPLKILYNNSMHPTVSGTYLTCLVFYKIITNKKAKSLGLSYIPKGVKKWFLLKAQRIVDIII